MFGRITCAHRQRFGPVLPVAVFNFDGDGRADRLAVAHAAEEMRSIRLDAHATAASVALLAAPQLAIDEFVIDGHARRQPRKKSHKALPMRLAGSGKTQHDRLIPLLILDEARLDSQQFG